MSDLSRLFWGFAPSNFPSRSRRWHCSQAVLIINISIQFLLRDIKPALHSQRVLHHTNFIFSGCVTLYLVLQSKRGRGDGLLLKDDVLGSK